MAEEYGIDIKLASIDDQVVEDWIERFLVPSLPMLGKKMGWELNAVLRGDVLSIEAKRGGSQYGYTIEQYLKSRTGN